MSNVGIIRNFDTTNLVALFNTPATREYDNPNDDFSGGNVRTAIGASAPAAGVTITRKVVAGAGYQKSEGAELFNGGAAGLFFLTDHNPAFTNASKHYWETTVQWDGSTQVTIFGASDDANNEYFGKILNNGKLELSFEVATVIDHAVSTDVLTRGLRRVGFMKDGATLKLYIDGTEVAAYDVQDNYALGNKSYTNDMHIGAYDEATDNFNSYMYCFMWFDDAISDARIANHSAIGKSLGLRLSPSGQLIDPSAVVATAINGSAYKYGKSTRKFEITIRSDQVDQSGIYCIKISENKIPAEAFVYCSRDDLSDFVFTQQNGTRLMRSRNVAACSKAAQTCTFYVKIDLIAGVDTTIICQIGGDSIADDASAFTSIYDGTASLHRWFSLDEAAGVAIDSVGANNGTVTGMTQGADGHMGNCGSFDGAVDNIDCNDVNQFDGATKLALFGWFNRANDAATRYSFRKYLDATHYLYIYDTGVDAGSSYTWRTSVFQAYGSYTVPRANTWKFIVRWLDTSKATNATKCLRSENTRAVSHSFVNNVAALDDTAVADLTIGYSAATYNGLMDEIRVVTWTSDSVSMSYFDTQYNLEYNGNDNGALDFGRVSLIPQNKRMKSAISIGIGIGL